jgi:hypothetical protein
MIAEYRNNVIVDKSFSFALKIVGACELLDERRKYVISKIRYINRSLRKRGSRSGKQS